MTENHSVEFFSLQAEQSLLACLLTDATSRDDCIHLLNASDFVIQRNKMLFEVLSEMSRRNVAIDVITVNEYLTQKNLLEKTDGFPFLVSLSTSVFSPTNAKAYAKIVRGLSLKRKALALSAHYQEKLSDPSLKDIEETLFDFSNDLEEIKSLSAAKKSEVKSLADVTSEVLDEIDARSNGTYVEKRLFTGIESFDEAFESFTPGSLIILGARPAMGKTSFALDITCRISTNQQYPSLVFSFEMLSKQLSYRILSSKSQLQLSALKGKEISEIQWGQIGNGVHEISNINILISDQTNLTVHEISSIAKKAVRTHGGLSMIMIDYLQLINLGPKAERNKAEAIEDASRFLKILAQDLGVPVLVLSQLNRQLEQRADKRPMVSDLRGSGGLEQDADAIILLYRDEVYNPDTMDKGITEVIIGKQRDAPIAVVPLLSDLKTFTYSDRNSY